MRCDLLPSNMTATKEREVRALLVTYRRGAVLLGREQWRLFFETGRFNKYHDTDKVTFAAVIGSAARVQMCRWQVVGQLDSWLSNRANAFRDTVNGSSLDPDTRHMLHVINRAGAWFTRKDVVMRDTGEVIPDHIRRLSESVSYRPSSGMPRGYAAGQSTTIWPIVGSSHQLQGCGGDDIHEPISEIVSFAGDCLELCFDTISYQQRDIFLSECG
jgi:hypothetical protein